MASRARRDPKYAGATACPKIEGEGWRERHQRRVTIANSHKGDLWQWCYKRGVTFSVYADGEVFVLKRNEASAIWPTSTERPP